MPYVGRDLQRGNYLKLDDISSSFDGSTTTFNLQSGGSAFYPGSAFSIFVSVGGVIQEPESAYTINKNTITFANAPHNVDECFITALGVALGVGVPGHGTVNGSQLAKPFNYDGGLLYLDSTNDRVGVGVTTPSYTLDVNGTANFSGNVTVGGTLTYQDVASIDAVGIATFQDDVNFNGTGAGISSSYWDKSANEFKFKDNVKLSFGDDRDLQLRHNNNDSVISHIAGATGNLKILSGGAQSIECVKAGAVNIAHNGTTKLNTRTDGVKITGGTDISMNSNGTGQLYMTGNGYTGGIALDATAMNIYHNSGSKAIIFGTNEDEKVRITSNGIVNIGDTTNNEYLNSTLKVRKDQNSVTRVTLRNENSGSGSAAAVQIGAYGNSWMLQCGSAANDSNAFTIRVDGTSNSNTGTEKLRIKTDGRVQIANGGDLYVVGSSYNAKLNGNILEFDRPGYSYIDQIHNSGSLNFRVTASQTIALRLDNSAQAIFPQGVIHLGTADSASGHLNAYETMTFNIDTDNDDTNRYFAFYNNGSSGSGSELLRITEGGAVQIGNLQTNQNTTTHASATKLHIDSTKHTKIARLGAGSVSSAGWYTVARISSGEGNHFKCIASIGGNFTQDVCVMELTGSWSASGGLSNTYTEPVFTAHRTGSHSTDRITKARFVKDGSNITYFQIYLAAGVDGNTWGKSVLESTIGAYSQNTADSNSYAMFAAGGTVTAIRTLEVVDNALCTNAGSHKIYTGGTEKLRITSDGKVLVGDGSSITPVKQFDVRGTGFQSILVGSTNNQGAQLVIDGIGGGDASGGNYSALAVGTGGNLEIKNYDADKGIILGTGSAIGANDSVVITSDGLFLIGTTSGTQGQVSIKNANDFSTASVSTNTDNIFLISDATSGDGVYGASIGFSRVQYADRRVAAIATRQHGTDEDQVGLSFFTHPGTDATDPVVEKLRISHDGRLLLGTQRTHGSASYYDDITINNSDGSNESGGTGITLISSTNSWGSILLGDSDDHDIGAIKYDHNNNTLRFVVNAIDPALLINSTGQLQATGAADVRLTLGSSGTAGTNDSVHIRADSADLKFMAASGGTTIFEVNGTETLRIDSSGNINQNNTSPLSGYSGYRHINQNNNLILQSSTSQSGGFTGMSNNAYVNSSGNWTRVRNDYASDIGMDDGNLWFRQTGAGTGNISWSTPFHIANDGKVYVNSAGSYGSSPGVLNIGRRAADPGGVTVNIARGEAIGGGTGPVLSLIHGPDGGTQRTHNIYSYVGDFRVFADANENLEIRGANIIMKNGNDATRATLQSGGDMVLADGGFVSKATSDVNVDIDTSGWSGSTYYDVISSNVLADTSETYLITYKWQHEGAGSPYVVQGQFLFSPTGANHTGYVGPEFIPVQSGHSFYGPSRYFKFKGYAAGNVRQGLRAQATWTPSNNNGHGNLNMRATPVAKG